jgi:uncharacterized ion transporter superfamily protein YfcC
MTPETLTVIADLAQTIAGLSVPALLVIIVIALVKEWVIPKGRHEAAVEHADKRLEEFKTHAETQTKLLAREVSDAIVEGTEKAVERGTAKGVVAAIDYLRNGGENAEEMEI